MEEEWGLASVIMWPNIIGLGMAGPAVHLFGTDEQKRRFLPPIAKGEVIWFQTFTEPDAGSDEANQQTRAVADGEYFIINGQKTFISGAYKPDYLYTLARTADTIPKHRGISLFLIPADLPGISYHPLPTMGHRMDGIQNEIFFDDVRVPKNCLLGELNRGFYHAMATFEFERSGTGFPSRARRAFEEIVHFCKEEKRNGKPLIEDQKVREKLAEMAVELEVWRLIAWQSVWRFSQREKLGPQPYDLTGFYWKTLYARQGEVMMNIMGLHGQLKKGSKWVKLAGSAEQEWQAGRSPHPGGTLEIQKVVLAQRGLGLPRIPANLMTEIGKAVREAERA